MNISLIPEKDPNAERRRALAKVYSLLIHLAEKSENKPIHQELAGAKETEASIIVQTNPSTNEVDFVPSPQNIPP